MEECFPYSVSCRNSCTPKGIAKVLASPRMKLIEDKWSFQELFEDVYGEDDSDVCAPTPVCFKILWLWNQKPLFLVSSPKLLKQYRKSH